MNTANTLEIKINGLTVKLDSKIDPRIEFVHTYGGRGLTARTLKGAKQIAGELRAFGLNAKTDRYAVAW